jgi:hypothetical protein
MLPHSASQIIDVIIANSLILTTINRGEFAQQAHQAPWQVSIWRQIER